MRYRQNSRRHKTNVEPSVVEQPFKIPFVAAIIIIINPQKPEVAQEILARAAKAMQEHLEAGHWREGKLVLRLLACLQGLLEEDGVFPLLEELFSRAVDLQTASSEDVSILLVLLVPQSKLIRSASEPGFGTCQDHLTHDTLCHGLVRNWL